MKTNYLLTISKIYTKNMENLYKKFKLIALTISILTSSFAFALHDEQWSYIENSEVKLGVITNYGSVIGYFSEISPVNNFINYVDAGREIQQSYYGWDDGSSWAGGDWVWNPVQGGNSVGDKPRLLEFSNVDNKIYSKSNPRNWAGGELITDCVMEEWISLSGNVAHIVFKMTYTGPSNGPVAHQELPAVFVVKEYENLTFYGGPTAWTEGSLTNFKPGHDNGYDHRYEQWSAFVNNSGWGMGVYTPETTYQTRYWRDGSGGNEGWGCSYFAPVGGFAITSNNFSYQYDVYLTIGTTNEIRETFNDIRKSNFNHDPLPALQNPGFEKPAIPWVTTTNLVENWNCNGQQIIQYGPSIAPLAGQVAWYNGVGSLFQSLPGGRLQPDSTYQLTFDAHTIAGWSPKTIHAGIMFGHNNSPYAALQNTNVENFAISSGNWLGSGWAGGGLFNTISNPPPNNPAMTHTLMFDTPVSNIIGNYLNNDLTIAIWDSSGIQVQVDNVRVTNYPRNRAMLPEIVNGTFDSPVVAFGTALGVISNWNNSDCGVINAAIVAPLSGQCAYFNNSVGCVQTFPGKKLQPNMNYRITFDSITVNGNPLRTLKAGLGHARYFGDESRFICPLDDTNVINVNQGSGIWLGKGWASGALFTNVLDPSANDPAISHIFSFTTPATLTGNKLAFDLGVKVWDVAGAQVKLDNLVVTNFPLPEPGIVFSFLFSVFGIFFILRKM